MIPNALKQICENTEAISQIPIAIKQNWDLIMLYVTASQRRELDAMPKLENITIHTMLYSKLTSNSHSAPKNGARNWGGLKKEYPTGYPGYNGIIEFSTDISLQEFAFRIFEPINIHTGTGGGGNKSYYYSFTLFLDDWPRIKQNVLAKILTGQRP